MVENQKFVVWISEVDKQDIPSVGGKGANLGEMVKIGVPVPAAFIVTSAAYFYFLEKAGIRQKIRQSLETLNLEDPNSLVQVAANVQKIILRSAIPREVSDPIVKSYFKLGGLFKHALVAVRSSATAEDLPTASFAGQQETFLNVSGEANVIEKVRSCWASLFTPRAIFYREEKKFDHFKVGIAVPIQKMIQSEESGVMFTIDPVTNNKSKIVIEAVYGLGEMMVQGKIIPDHYEVEKKTLRILVKEQVPQETMLVKRKNENKEVPVPKRLSQRQKLTETQIEKLADIGRKIERHYFFPQDLEWAIEKGKIFIVQTRPVTTIKKEAKPEVRDFISSGKRLMPIVEGQPASPGIASGPVKIIKSAKEINKIVQGDILVTEMTNPDFVPAMKKTAAIVTDQGGRTAHAAIVSRELGIPCVVGTKNATQVLKNGLVVTVNGGTGRVYKGGALKTKVGVQSLISEASRPVSTYAVRTATKVYVNLAEPERAKEIASLPVDGVGLLRAEFIIAQFGVHPRKIIKDKKQKSFIDKMAQDIGIFCQAFNPRPVVYRATDFKTSEYRNLSGGKDFEPEEENPMIGFRGAYRYIKDPDVFEMELEALKIVRNKMNFRNLWLMIPFVRTPKELLEVKRIVASKNLMRSSTFKLWLMVEVPSNVILLEKFIDAGIDGVSIGSNDLTMLLLGADRNNAEVASEFSEKDPAVLWALEKTIKTCQKSKITCSICGQAPSDYPELVENLVRWGITSVSLNPDVAISTRQVIYQAEKKLCQR